MRRQQHSFRSLQKAAATFMTTLALMAGTSCTKGSTTLTVSNPTGQDRVTESVEVALEAITGRLGLEEGETFIIEKRSGEEQPYQITSDSTVVFPIRLKAGETRDFTVRRGNPMEVKTISCGQVYPARYDDLAWENDKVSFRAYGPALQAKGEKGFGYDLFAKRGTDYPVLEEMYRLETDKALKARIKELRENGHKAEGDALHASKSYHVDRGYGMDCYAVGPTLGAGVAALVENGEMVYPWCWKECEILDNGPLRFKVKLTFTPLTVAGRDDVIETRIITLDAGARLNKTEISYSNISKEMEIVSGIVLHDTNDYIRTEAEEGWISYQDPTTGPGKGLLYLGHAVKGPLVAADVNYFSAEESAARNKAKGHVLAHSLYHPETGFTYWWGFGWSKADIATYDDWNSYMTTFAAQLRKPLVIKLK